MATTIETTLLYSCCCVSSSTVGPAKNSCSTNITEIEEEVYNVYGGEMCISNNTSSKSSIKSKPGK